MPLGLLVIGFRESQVGGTTWPEPALLYSWSLNRHLQLMSILGCLTEILLALRPFGLFILAVWTAHRFASYKLALATLGIAAAGIGFRLSQQGLPAPLRHEGVEELVRRAQTSLDLDAKPRIAYRSVKGTLTYRDSSGTVPTADRLRRHLDLLVGLAELNARRNRRPL